MLDELDTPVISEALACRVEHDLGEVNTDANDLGTIALQQREQATVARSEVKYATTVARYLFEQDALSLCAMREAVGPVEIVQDALRVSPLAHRSIDHQDIMRVGRCLL